MDLSKLMGTHNPIYANRSKWKKNKAVVLEAKKSFYNSVRWQKLRDQALRSFPLCYRCEVRGYTNQATVVDHILVFENKNDPLATDTDNLRPLCATCHAMVTNKENTMRYKWLKRYKDGESIKSIAKEKYRADIVEVDNDGYRII